MGMDLGDFTHNIGPSNKKRGTRRLWTKDEEEALLNILDMVIAEEGCTDNGTFKPGTIFQIEREMSKMLPNCDIRASPHIDSMMRKLKKQYGVIFDMLNTSGFGWNDIKKCVEVGRDSVWEAYVQSHKDVASWRNKPFPIYERLVNIFGIDCATGLGAETPCEMAERVNDEINNEDDVELGDDYSPMSMGQPGSNSQPSNKSTSQSSSRKRGMSRDNIVICMREMAAKFEQVYANSVERMTMLAERIFSDKEDRSDIADELTTIGLTEFDELEALTHIVEKPSNIYVFKSLKGERKLAFVLKVLGKGP